MVNGYSSQLLGSGIRAQFYTHVMKTGADKILITGDIAEALDGDCN